MADPKATLDDAADTANTWWAWAMSYVPEKWKRYVALVMFLLAILWLLPTITGVVKDTMGWAFPPQQVSDFESKTSGTQKAHADAIIDLDKRVGALEAKATQPPPLTTGSTTKLKQR